MIECIKFRSHTDGHLQGFADFFVPKWGMEIYGCSLYSKDGRRWINFPSRKYQNPEGETKYAPYFRFPDPKHFEAFIEQAKHAIDKWCQENANNDPEFPDSSPDVEECPF